MGEAESPSKLKHHSELQEGTSHIWHGTRGVLESATKWAPPLQSKQMRYPAYACGRSLRQIQRARRQSAFLLMALPSWSRISWRLLFALVTNCFSLWSMKPSTLAHKSTFVRPIPRREGGTFFRPRSVTRHSPEKISAITSSFPMKFLTLSWEFRPSTFVVRP